MLLVEIASDMIIARPLRGFSRPGGGKGVGTMHKSSKTKFEIIMRKSFF